MENEPVQSTVTPDIKKDDVPPVVTPKQSQPEKKSFPLPMWAIVIILLIVSVILGYVTSQRVRTSSTSTDNTGSVPTIAPPINQGLSPIATTSAFMQLEESIASLSARIAGFNPTDPQIVPPVLDLPLGFSK